MSWRAQVRYTAIDMCTIFKSAIRAALPHAQLVRALERQDRDAVHGGELPAGTDPGALAAFYGAVLQGMSAQAGDGATTGDPQQIADRAVLAWPNPAR